MCFSGKPHSSTGVNHGATIVKMDRVEVVVFDFGLEDGPVGDYSCGTIKWNWGPWEDGTMSCKQTCSWIGFWRVAVSECLSQYCGEDVRYSLLHLLSVLWSSF